MLRQGKLSSCLRMALSAKHSQRFWRAVTARDSRIDGAFVYAVRSTGVYCRPSCPARRPRSRQVVFFRTPNEARRHGFRACRRCWVQETARAVECASVARLCRALEQGDGQREARAALQSLAVNAGISPRRLRQAFQRFTGVTPRGYADQARLHRLKHRLRRGEDVTTAMYESGYGASSRLYECSNHQLGMTPGAYSRGGRGMEIRYTISRSPIGRILVAGTDRGVSAIYLGRSDAQLTATLRRE